MHVTVELPGHRSVVSEPYDVLRYLRVVATHRENDPDDPVG